MRTSILDLFSVGIGPSSSHTVGPMRAGGRFCGSIVREGILKDIERIGVVLYGSLAATAVGHGTLKAVLAGLIGERPETVDPDKLSTDLAEVRDSKSLRLAGLKTITFVEDEDIALKPRERMDFHVNGMEFFAFDTSGGVLLHRVYYSVGGGFVVSEGEADADKFKVPDRQVPYPFSSGESLLIHAHETGQSIADIVLTNETAWRPRDETYEQLLHLWSVMEACVERGCAEGGQMPGLKLKRRAADMASRMQNGPDPDDHLAVMDWVNLWALAVNEENATGGRVVTAPTNGAAGIIPAVLHYYTRYCKGASDDGVVRFLATAGAIGLLFKENASISGAEVGCQGEVGSACAMAAAGLTEVLGGTPEQVENAAEIGMEHNLGLTCDPVGGLVQVPCIERNAMGAMKAINASRLALKGDGDHFVSLDKVIHTMRITGEDMKSQYKETAEGGLAGIIPIDATVIDC